MKLFNYHSGEYFNWFINNPLRTYWKVKKYFRPMTLHWYIGSKLMSPIPPYGHCAKILDIYSTDVIWKDKYNTPRHEYDPCISIILFNKWCIGCYWKFELNNRDYSMHLTNMELNGCDHSIVSNNKTSWIKTMEMYLKDKKESWYKIPEGVVGVLTDPTTGEVATEDS